MVFSRRLAALAAVVLIPLGIAATSFALTDTPREPRVPAKVELESGSPKPSPTSTATSTATATPTSAPSDQVVTRPPVTDGPRDDDDDDEAGTDDGAGDDE